MMNYQNQISLEEIFQVLSSPVRLKILELLANGTRCVNCIAEEIDLNQPAVSQHLKVLRMAGLVKPDREGKFVHYSICEEGIDLICDFLKRLSETSVQCKCPMGEHKHEIHSHLKNGGSDEL